MKRSPQLTASAPLLGRSSLIHQELTSILIEGCLNVDSDYINFKVQGAEGKDEKLTIYRERVYCYELYHQMRRLMDMKAGPNASTKPSQRSAPFRNEENPHRPSFVLNGEVDKNSHPRLMETEVGARKPDFLVHCPGYGNDFNDTIIEVKKSDVDKSGILKDLESLYVFSAVAQYKRAIFLVYGADPEKELGSKLTEVINDLKPMDSENYTSVIEIWFHSCPEIGGQNAQVKCVGYLEVTQACFQK